MNNISKIDVLKFLQTLNFTVFEKMSEMMFSQTKLAGAEFSIFKVGRAEFGYLIMV